MSVLSRKRKKIAQQQIKYKILTMAIILELNGNTNPRQFITNLTTKINRGSIETWEIDNEGDFTLTSQVWQNKAWFRPRFPEPSNQAHQEVSFGLISSKRYRLTKAVYAVFHARLAETLLAYCDNDIEKIHITSLMDSNIDFI